MSKVKQAAVIWVTWERQPRNRSMTKGLGIPLFEILSNRGDVLRYLSCAGRTVRLLVGRKPKVVVCQNPSIVLTVLLLVLRSFLGIRVAIDAHFGGIDAGNGSRASQSLLDWCNRKADLVIVTNSDHADQVARVGGRPFVCPDPLPDLSTFRSDDEEIQKKLFLICSFDVDEPYQEVFKAAESLAEEGYHLFASGNYRKAGVVPGDYPHVTMLGFVPEEEFYGHLFSSQVIIDLTDNDNCLVCGAYEAMEAEKPLVLSNKKALRDYFTGGVVFSENRAGPIAEAAKAAYADRGRLKEGARDWVRQARKDMESRLTALREVLGRL